MARTGDDRLAFRHSTDVSPWGSDAVSEAKRAGYGAVYTRSWVADFILDLSGYVPEKNLVDAIAVEPSCGDGEFLEPMVRRLSDSCRRQVRPLKDCIESIHAFELDSEAAAASRKRAETVLLDCGWDRAEVEDVVQGWITQADFLLDAGIELISKLGAGIDFVIGNPPYVRLEAIDSEVADHYRKLFSTMTGRADIYVGFYEKALELLKQGGVCGFICADRWMLNQYGSNLRRLITKSFGVEAIIEMHDADAFQNEVLAYPAITIIRRERQGRVLVAKMDRSRAPSAAEIVDKSRLVHSNLPADHHIMGRENNSVVVDEWFRGQTRGLAYPLDA